MVNEKLKAINHSVIPIHRSDNPIDAVKDAEIIIIGGGNTFRLLKMLHANKMMETIKQKVMTGTPYTGWSAGETRETRIKEFIELNPDFWVFGLREGTMLKIENQSIRLIGEKTARVFRKGEAPIELGQDDDFGFLM